MRPYVSWNRRPPVAPPLAVRRPAHRFQPLPHPAGAGLIAYGNGRSYSDVGLLAGGTLIDTRGLDRFVAFDAGSGVLRAEAGMRLDTVLALAVPHGWFLPVTPGTREVTLGGALANDVHGKNHHAAGTFGCHVRGFELLRSDGSRRWCSADEHAGLFGATIGGLGLTGLVTVVELQLRRIATPVFEVENRRFAALAGFFELDAELRERHEYTVAWIDCAARGARLGRGLYGAGAHAEEARADDPGPPRGHLGVPFMLPGSTLNRWSVAAFNALTYGRPRAVHARVHYQRWLYPLDRLAEWHRLYGRAGFVQFQCVVPPPAAPAAIGALLGRIAHAGEGSPLAVLKTFGERRSPGLLSFPRPGCTLALDFPWRGATTAALLAELHAIVRDHAGRIYPAKDSTSPPSALVEGYPALDEFRAHIDPAFRSGYALRHGLVSPPA